MPDFDLVTIGDALIDHFLTIHETSRFCEAKQDTHQFCFVSGSKIMVDSSEFHLGGNACNVAVGSSRLGMHTAIVAEIGQDEFSQKITVGLQKDNVELSHLQQTSGAASTFSISLSFMADRTNFVHHVERQHEIDIEDLNTKMIYLTSLGKEWKPMYARVLTYRNTHPDTVLVFNPGSPQMQEGRESFKDILAVTDILMVNKEEAEQILYGTVQHTENRATTSEVLLKELQKLGPQIVCVTDGLNGSFVIDTDGTMHTQGLAKANMIQKTGAGDAYSTGFLGALLYGEDLPSAMKWGAVSSASVIEHIGAQVGLLTKESLQERLQTV